MDMGTTTMDMGATGTTTSVAAATTSMSMSMGGSSSCKISMLWNWYTVDSCFLSSSWHVTSSGMFAGSCIGVILLVMSLEMMRRLVKEYDSYLIRKHAASFRKIRTPIDTDAAAATTTVATGSDAGSGHVDKTLGASGGFRPTFLEQAVRALLHMIQFAVAYFVMLLAMYYNGYIIICIFIGAYLGAFCFQWEVLGGSRSTSAAKEATVCCG